MLNHDAQTSLLNEAIRPQNSPIVTHVRQKYRRNQYSYFLLKTKTSTSLRQLLFVCSFKTSVLSAVFFCKPRGLVEKKDSDPPYGSASVKERLYQLYAWFVVQLHLACTDRFPVLSVGDNGVHFSQTNLSLFESQAK